MNWISSIRLLPALSTVLSFAAFTPGSAHAESGYRVCFVKPWNGGHRGLAVKVAKGNGDDTCSKKMDWMVRNYPKAWAADIPNLTKIRMYSCEDFQKLLNVVNSGAHAGDVCKIDMQVNRIYKFDNWKTPTWYHD